MNFSVINRIKNTLLWATGGAVFGVVFAVTASLLHMGPELYTGIGETWWWFAALGSFAGYFRPIPELIKA